MKNIIIKSIYSGILISFISCSAQTDVIQKIKKEGNKPFSYAELSVKEGGKWEGNKIR